MTRTLAISDDVYEMVSKAQMKGESFSDVIRRVLKRQKISDIPKIFDESEWEKVEKAFGRQKELDTKRGEMITFPDIIIAATALTYDLILVTGGWALQED